MGCNWCRARPGKQAGCWRHTVIPIKRGGWLWQLSLCRILPQQNGCCSMSRKEECPDLAQCHLAVAEGWQQPQLTVFCQHPKNNFDQFSSLKGNCYYYYYYYWTLIGNYTNLSLNSICIICWSLRFLLSCVICSTENTAVCEDWDSAANGRKHWGGGLTPPSRMPAGGLFFSLVP